ncbi:unnamed protein product [Toxocara canis]|uniref:Ovule protein n=1 Tax=Toxocara canis TaxID=6265 RepID=A0A183TVL1_TOXCA|nr:unnamed protein product [Toxocara canis]
MIHVFNSPIDPSSMAEFQRSKQKEEEIFKSTTNKRKITYTKDGRRIVDGKIEAEQKPGELWSVALTRSMANDLKDRCDDDNLAQSGRNFWEYRKRIHTTIVSIALLISYLQLFH